MIEPRAALTELWREKNAQFPLEGLTPVHFGDADQEARAARSGAVLFDRSERDFLRITGGRVRTMLQGQLTNDIQAIAAGQGCYAAHLDAKGRMLSDLVVEIEADDAVMLEFEPGMGAEVARRFAPFAMLDDLEIDELAERAILMLVGPDAAALLEKVLDVSDLEELAVFAHRDLEFEDETLRVAARAETGERGYQLRGSETLLVDIAERLFKAGIRPAGSEAFEILRIEAGTPIWGKDMNDRNLPPECNIPQAISYTKGCYVGQETVARIKTYGQANKGLRGLKTAGLMPDQTELTTRDGKVVGVVTSSIWSPHLEAPVAMGYVQRDHVRAGMQLLGRHEREVFEVEVTDLPFVPRKFEPSLPR